MSNLESKDFGLKIYNRFPPKYREDDVFQNYALKRYIEALSDGGFKYAIDEINGLMDLIDPVKVDSKVLPLLFKQYGLEVFNGIPENYLRYLLPRLGEAWSKKGSLSVIEFITSSLSGIKTVTDVTYDSKDNPYIGVRLEMDSSIGNYFPEVKQFYRILKNFVPFYCDFGIVYSYMYYDNKSFSIKDYEDTIKIKDNKLETTYIPFDKGSRFYPLLNDKRMSLNGSFILNRPFSSDVETDSFEDNVSYQSNEKGILSESEPSFLNMESTLNNFYTNSINCMDKITIKGVTEVIYR